MGEKKEKVEIRRDKHSSKSSLSHEAEEPCLQTKHWEKSTPSKTRCDKLRSAPRAPERAPIPSTGHGAGEERRGQGENHTLESEKKARGRAL